MSRYATSQNEMREVEMISAQKSAMPLLFSDFDFFLPIYKGSRTYPYKQCDNFLSHCIAKHRLNQHWHGRNLTTSALVELGERCGLPCVLWQSSWVCARSVGKDWIPEAERRLELGIVSSWVKVKQNAIATSWLDFWVVFNWNVNPLSPSVMT